MGELCWLDIAPLFLSAGNRIVQKKRISYNEPIVEGGNGS